MTCSEYVTCLDGAASRLTLLGTSHCTPPLLPLQSVLLLRRPVWRLPADLMAEGRLGKDEWKGGRPQLHTPAMSFEILPETASVEAPEGPRGWI